jgi:hypothetical protein
MRIQITITVDYDSATVEDEDKLIYELEQNFARIVGEGCLLTGSGKEVIDLYEIDII